MLFGIWMPELHTRSHIHSVADRSLIGNFFRITSFADEPSFMVPFIIDGILIFSFYKQRAIIAVFVVLLIFSMSLGGYVNLAIIGLCGLFLSRRHIRLTHICIAIFLLLAFIVLFYDKLSLIFELILSRGELSSSFSVTDSPRTEMIVYPWKYLFEDNFVTTLFGNGPSSMKYLNKTKILATGEPYHVTSNNIFTDIGFEEGIVGVIGLVIFFSLLYRFFIIIKTRDRDIDRCSLYGKLFVIHLLISSLYRADFMSPRFWIVVSIIFALKFMTTKRLFYNK
jgi:hypothetical protein